MNDTYVEILVKKQPKSWYSFVKGLLVFSSIWVFAVLGLFQVNVIFIILGIILSIVTYFVFQELDLEYEYLYVNGELTVDKIKGKSSRKQCINITMDLIEVVAPFKSFHLDEYDKKNKVLLDYSSGTQPDNLYVIYFKGKKGLAKLLFEPNEKMLDSMRMLSPRKVFFE